MELFVLWSFCAITGAVIAGRKNRSIFGWFLLSAIFGVFAVIAVVLLPILVHGDQLQRHLAQLRTMK
jgi:uncharacterized membrane protein